MAHFYSDSHRYIHSHQRLAQSPFVPAEGREVPVPKCKRVDYLQDALPESDREKASASRQRITEAEYRMNFWDDL